MAFASTTSTPASGSKSTLDLGTIGSRSIHSTRKIIELYTLQVLPRNNEWQYAKDFITMTDIIDDESKDEMLHALRALEEERSGNEAPPSESPALRGKVPQREHGTGREPESIGHDASKLSFVKEHPGLKNNNNEQDFGIDDSIQKPSTSNLNVTIPNSKESNSKSRSVSSKRSTFKQAVSKKAQSGVRRKNAAFIDIFKRLIHVTTKSLSNNPAALLRFVLLAIAFIVTLSRDSVRARVGRLTEAAWDSLRRTFGMGMKVSYI